MKTLHFNVITDGRFGGTRELLEERVKKIIEDLRQLEGVEIVNEEHLISGIYQLYFEDEESCQWRTEFYVAKKGRKTTWNDVYGTVNKTYAPYYKFV